MNKFAIYFRQKFPPQTTTPQNVSAQSSAQKSVLMSTKNRNSQHLTIRTIYFAK